LVISHANEEETVLRKLITSALAALALVFVGVVPAGAGTAGFDEGNIPSSGHGPLDLYEVSASCEEVTLQFENETDDLAYAVVYAWSWENGDFADLTGGEDPWVVLEVGAGSIERFTTGFEPGTGEYEVGFWLGTEDVETGWRFVDIDCGTDTTQPPSGEVTATVIAETCELVRVGFTNGTDEVAVIDIRVDDERRESAHVEPGESKKFSARFDEGTGTHMVEYRINGGDWESISVDCPLTCVDLNTADVETLQLLKHIGSDRAQEIVDLRPIESFEELAEIDGISLDGVRYAELLAGGDGFLPPCALDGDDEEPPAEDDDEKLPDTGFGSPLILVGGLSLLALGGAGLALTRRSRATTPL
jgi:LPXTG-motif cell wall-anchored protein